MPHSSPSFGLEWDSKITAKSQRANSLARTRPQRPNFSKIQLRVPDHNLAIQESLRIREQNSQHSLPSRSCMS